MEKIKVPDNPNTWLTTLNQLPSDILGGIMAMLIAVLRVIYDKEETRPTRIFLESLLCGALSLVFSSAISAMELDKDWAIFVGGMIGFFGTVTVRSLAIKFVSSKIVFNKKK